MFTIPCEHCQKKVEFESSEVDGLEAHIAAERADARSDAEGEFDGWIDPYDFTSSITLLAELSVAIERGDKAEAKILLDQIAGSLGEGIRERVELARFSPQARLPLPLPHVPV